jgi:hypothetical protein
VKEGDEHKIALQTRYILFEPTAMQFGTMNAPAYFHGYINNAIVGPILVQREAYINLWYSCQIGDAYIDLSIHLFDTYTRSRVSVTPLLNPNLTPRDERTQSLPCTPPGRYHDRKTKP